MAKTSVATVPTWEETSTSFKATGYYSIKKTKGNKYAVSYVWYNPFDEKISSISEFDSEEEAKKVASQFPKNEKIYLYDVVYRFKKVGVKFK